MTGSNLGAGRGPLPAADTLAAGDALADPSDALAAAAGQRLLWVFRGSTPTPDVLAAIRSRACPGVVLYRHLNIVSPAQVRDLCAALQAARPEGDPPLIIATDQEGGQLQAIGDGATAWPGNLALGAAGSSELARRAGAAIAAELTAVGINLDYAPVCDIANDPTNPVIGTRAFGDEPAPVAALAAAFVEGLQSAGVAGSAKHFPGHGAARGDSHTGLPVVERERDELADIELVPFRAAIEGGVKTVMIGHLAVPSVDDGLVRPATASPAIVRRLLRASPIDGGLGYDGVVVSDALDMGAIQLPGGLCAIAVAAARAGIDLLTPGPLQADDVDGLAAVPDALVEAAASGDLDEAELLGSAARVLALRRWLGDRDQADAAATPPLDVMDSAEHRALAAEIAERSLTLVRDPGHLVPLPADSARVVAIVPRPADLTPADTSSLVRIDLAGALGARGREALGLEIGLDPEADEIAKVVERAEAWTGVGRGVRSANSEAPGAGIGRASVVLATIDARSHPGQARLAEALVAAGNPTIVAVLRSPHDAAIVPESAAVVCAYAIQPPTIDALAAALCGEATFPGHLPVKLARLQS